MDDLGYGELNGANHHSAIPTPNIDSIAQHGVRFTQAYVVSPVCAPSRMALLGGRYPQRFGQDFNPKKVDSLGGTGFGLPASVPTLAERLKVLGYATAAVGKWHLGYASELRPLARGFQNFFGFLSGEHSYWPRRSGGSGLLRNRTPVDEPEYLTMALAREAVAFIRAPRSQPFFLYLAFNAPHAPLQAIPAYLRRFAHLKDRKRATFSAMVAALDDAIGRVVTGIRESGNSGNTAIIFLSDNGGPTAATSSRNDPLRGGKFELFEGGIRVPMVFEWPGRLPAGKVISNSVSALDIYPSVLAIAGIKESPSPLDGIDLLPLIKGEGNDAAHRKLFFRYGDAKAVRDGDWKWIWPHGAARPSLYNLADDEGESLDLSARFPARLTGLADDFKRWNAEMVPPRAGVQAESD